MLTSVLPEDALTTFDALAAPFLTERAVGASQELAQGFDRDSTAARCRDALEVPSGGWSVDALVRLRKLLEIRIHAGEPCLGAWRLLDEVCRAVGTIERCRPLDDDAAWRTALAAAAEILRHEGERAAPLPNSREGVVAQALLRLRRKGYKTAFDGYGPRLTRPSLQSLCHAIDAKVARAGGRHTAEAMLNLMARTGRLADGTLIHARTPSMLGNDVRVAGTPWHYVYNLAVKHVDRPGRASNPEPVLEAMEELAQALAAVVDVEPHSTYENLRASRANVTGILSEATIYDELFAFPQWQPMAAEALVPSWFDALARAGCAFPVLAVDEWQAVASRLLARSRPTLLVPVGAADLSARGVSAARAEAALAALRGPGRPNARYLTPLDTKDRTGSWSPFVGSGRNGTLLQPTAIMTRALCERIYALMREAAVPDLENRMGRALELTLVDMLAEFGLRPSVVNGFYPDVDQGGRLEVDVAVETPERIVLFECTKKPLTTAARGGGVLAALRDIEGSFLKLTQQLARHEAELRRNGAIRFSDGGVLALKGRSVEKVGVNLFDHGSLQNRDFTISFLETLMGTTIGSGAPGSEEVVALVNRRLSKLNRSLRVILAAQPDGDRNGGHRFAMSTWWLSVDQLRYALMKGRAEGDPWTVLDRLRHLTSRSGDFVHEVRRSRDLNPVALAMLEVSRASDARAIV